MPPIALGPPAGWLVLLGFHVAVAAIMGLLGTLLMMLDSDAVTAGSIGMAIAGYWVLQTVFGTLFWQSRLHRMRDRRAGEDIGTFARSFNRRAVDPYVIRAVWDEVQIHLGGGDAWIPIRASDDLFRAFRWDEDDLEYALERSADRSGRTLDGLTTNPHYGHVTTVGDWVHLLNGQPSVEAARI